MTTLLSADYHGNPLPCATWQADMRRELAYFTRAFQWRFRHLPPDLREERVQEAIVQVCAVMAQQYAKHGGRITYAYTLVWQTAYRVTAGHSSTRTRCHNADMLDRSPGRTICPQREQGEFRPDTRPARREVSPAFRLDVEAWVNTLPPRLREYATLACRGTPDADIQRIMGIGPVRMSQIQTECKKAYADRP